MLRTDGRSKWLYLSIVDYPFGSTAVQFAYTTRTRIGLPLSTATSRRFRREVALGTGAPVIRHYSLLAWRGTVLLRAFH